MCGKPVICSNVIGIAQFVVNKSTGFICNNDNDYIAAYSNIEDNNILKEMATNARQYYETQLEWSANIKQMLKQFNVI